MKHRHIPWFNPRELDDAAVLALATGRSPLVRQFLQQVRSRLDHPAPGRHWLVTGVRGAGKSYFLRLLQATCARQLDAQRVRFLLLPEELPNVYAPHELLQEIKRFVDPQGAGLGASSAWRTHDPQAAWDSARQDLLGAFNEPLLIVGIENFQDLQREVFKDDISASLLRSLLAHETRLMFVVTSVDGDVDQDYQQRLFRQFEHHALPRWDQADHRAYLSARSTLLGETATDAQLIKIDAYSRFTGGNARVAAILAGAILDAQDYRDTGADFNATLDVLSDYYRELLTRMPANTRRLFDALVRGGEPCSQTALAERVGARQNDITRAFRVLMDHGYLTAKRDFGEKEIRYSVADRLFVQWYRMRYLEPGKRPELAVMTELIAETMTFREKWGYARVMEQRGHRDDARLMAELGLDEIGIKLQELMQAGMVDEEVLRVGESLVAYESSLDKAESNLEHWVQALLNFDDDRTMASALDELCRVLVASNRFSGEVLGKDLAGMIKNSLSLTPIEKWEVLRFLLQPNCSQIQWGEIGNLCRDGGVLDCFDDFQGDLAPFVSEALQQSQEFPVRASWIELSDSSGALAKFLRSEVDQAFVGGWAAILGVLLYVKQRSELFVHLFQKNADQLFDVGEVGVLKDLLETAYVRLPWSPGDSVHNFMLQILRRAIRCQGFDSGRAMGRAREFILKETAGDLNGQLKSILKVHSKSDSQWGWAMGQMARVAIEQSDLTRFTEIVAEIRTATPSVIHHAYRQLADAISQTEQSQGHAPAFRVARQLLEWAAHQQSDMPFERLIQVWVIDMLEEQTSMPLIVDMIAEARVVARTDQQAAIAARCDLLQAWMDDLATPPFERETSRKSRSPDLVLTLESLASSLSFKTQLRFGLATRPQISPQALRIVQLIRAKLEGFPIIREPFSVGLQAWLAKALQPDLPGSGEGVALA